MLTKYTIVGRFASYALVGGLSTMPGPVISLETIEGANYLAIVHQLSALGDWRSSVARYEVRVLNGAGGTLVTFTEKNRPPGQGELLGGWLEGATRVENQELRRLLDTPDSLKLVDRVDGQYIEVIAAAVEVFEQKNPDLVQYRIEVVRDNELLLVIFTDRNLPPDTLGSTSRHAGFEVALDPDSLRVIRSNFVK
jgi:hypothetical protein